MNTQLTPNEKAVLIALVYNHYSTSDDENGMTWANCINDSDKPSGIKGKTLSGVVSSLAKKGWLSCGGSGNDATIAWATPEAFRAASHFTR